MCLIESDTVAEKSRVCLSRFLHCLIILKHPQQSPYLAFDPLRRELSIRLSSNQGSCVAHDPISDPGGYDHIGTRF